MINMNLLPPEIKAKNSKGKQSANVFSICLVVLVIILVLGAVESSLKTNLLQPQLDSSQAELSKANTDIASFEKQQQEALFINDRAEATTKILDKQTAWASVIQDLANSVPVEVQFVSLSADTEKTPNFVLQGTTNTERDAIKFKEKLENSPLFKEVAFKSSTTSTGTTSTDPNVPSTPSKLNFSLEFNLEKAPATEGTK